METLIENKTTNIFENETAAEPAPFYTNEKMSFYKNRLIAIEDIISIEDSPGYNENIKKHFDIFDPSISYNLTFEDEQGNTHIQKSTKKPKQIGDMFYYVIDNDKLTHIAHETDKVPLKKFIHLNKEKYDTRTGIKYKILSLFEKKPAIPVLYLLTALMMDLSFCIYCLGLEKISWLHVLTAASGLVVPILSMIYMNYIQEKCDKEIDEIISDRRENILNTFI